MRETKIIETEFGKNKISIKTYLTEKENREIIKIVSGSIQMKDGKLSDNVETDILIKYQDKLIEIWVVDIDGNSENITEKMLEMRKEDYRQVVNEITALMNAEEKKTI